MAGQTDTPVAWRFRIGMQNLWSYCEDKKDAEFRIKQSGVTKFELQPLFGGQVQDSTLDDAKS